MLLLPLASLVIGASLGYLAQRSRMCFVGGLRDFILVRDTDLLRGVLAFFVTAWLAFSVAGALGLVNWEPPRFADSAPVPSVALRTGATEPAAPTGGAARGLPLAGPVLALAAGGGLLLGLVSVIANGCPTRQHVLAAQGVHDALYYLIGFYLGIVIFYLITRPLLAYFL